MTGLEVIERIEIIKRQIDKLEVHLSTQENQEDLRYELDSACVSLDDAVDVIERDVALQHLQTQIPDVSLET